MPKQPQLARIAGSLLAMLMLAACAHQVGYEPDYVPPERPLFVADGKLLIVMPQEQQQLMYEGSPDSEIGSFTRLEIPFGAIMRDIATQVFGSCFARGIEFADSRTAATGYVLALEGELDKFSYRYERVIDDSLSVEEPTSWIIPEVQIAFHIHAYDTEGRELLEKAYDSGLYAGERYMVARASERINETLHHALATLMLQVANDVRPLLVGECEITDLAPAS